VRPQPSRGLAAPKPRPYGGALGAPVIQLRRTAAPVHGTRVIRLDAGL